jgi:hypothetical protein
MLLAPLDILRLDLHTFGFGVDHEQQHHLVAHQMETDDSGTAALTGILALPTHLARAVSAWNHVACTWVLGDEIDERLALLSRPGGVSLFLERGRLDNDAYFLTVHPNNHRQLVAVADARTGDASNHRPALTQTGRTL